MFFPYPPFLEEMGYFASHRWLVIDQGKTAPNRGDDLFGSSDPFLFLMKSQFLVSRRAVGIFANSHSLYVNVMESQYLLWLPILMLYQILYQISSQLFSPSNSFCPVPDWCALLQLEIPDRCMSSWRCQGRSFEKTRYGYGRDVFKLIGDQQ